MRMGKLMREWKSDAVSTPGVDPRVCPQTHLVKAAHNIATREVLDLLAGLHDQVTRRHLDRHAPPVAQPDVQAREAAFPVDRQEVEVVVVAREHGAVGAILIEVGAGRREQVRR